MRLILAALGMVLVLGSAALAQPAPDSTVPATAPVTTTDLRAPDQVAPAQLGTVDLRAPDQVTPTSPKSSVPAPVVDEGPAAIVFVLIGLGVAIMLVAGGYLGVRFRHRDAIADDLVTG